MSPDDQVLLDRHVTQDLSALHHMHDALGHPALDILACQVVASIAHSATRDFALLHGQHAGDGLERRTLACTVGTKKGRAAPLGHLEVDALECQDHLGVQDLEIFHRQ